MTGGTCINDRLGDDELRAILFKLELDKDKEEFGLVCKRWLQLQSTERRKICARAGPHMLKRLAARFTRLSELNLSQCVSRSFFPGVSDSDLTVIGVAFSSLRILNLHNCKGITDKGMDAIGFHLPLLQSLDVSYCRKVGDKGLTSIAKGCCDLRALRVAGCRLITDAVLKALSVGCKHVQELDLSDCTNLSDSGLTALVEGCKRFSHLDLSKCTNIGDMGICRVAEACCLRLSTLKLLDCYKVGDESIYSLAKYCNNLETLVVSGCRDVTDEAIKALASAACGANLKSVRMDWCPHVSDESLGCLLALCTKLEVLDVGCCEQVTDDGFRSLRGNATSSSRLKVVRVTNCPKITVDGITTVFDSCPALEYVDVRSCPHVTAATCREAGLNISPGCKVIFTGSIAADPNLLR